MVDYNPGGPRPPVPEHRIFNLGNIPEEAAWFALFSFYNGAQGRMPTGLDILTDGPRPPDETSSGRPTDSVIIEGDVLERVQQQEDALSLSETAKFVLGQNASNMFDKLKCGQSGLFTNRGRRLVMGDTYATRISLAFGRFSIYWDAVCEIGPKRCCVPDQACESGWRNEFLLHLQDQMDDA